MKISYRSMRQKERYQKKSWPGERDFPAAEGRSVTQGGRNFLKVRIM